MPKIRIRQGEAKRSGIGAVEAHTPYVISATSVELVADTLFQPTLTANVRGAIGDLRSTPSFKRNNTSYGQFRARSEILADPPSDPPMIVVAMGGSGREGLLRTPDYLSPFLVPRPAGRGSPRSTLSTVSENECSSRVFVGGEPGLLRASTEALGCGSPPGLKQASGRCALIRFSAIPNRPMAGGDWISLGSWLLRW
ncbi:hypothetical protein BO83DRAFT_443655 [Aspergillus eucalypticola CBS 122712]|uniref:Uncharacterized protein n=1 Tax=Aspergillus eucalypticola (strain CBS 122712 / IBT 29274) TaxID=1448314 RepID=A0A317VRX4_ASPEC|nr:uncharacterized protein BO83DRAFT_443655 [Aspergillus eucalypticola CBS 122712]PWY74650.1 hypothetical protein BO83DRAFT_443655 [Aspergillus eucalypticola CBS 122712]